VSGEVVAHTSRDRVHGGASDARVAMRRTIGVFLARLMQRSAARARGHVHKSARHWAADAVRQHRCAAGRCRCSTVGGMIAGYDIAQHRCAAGRCRYSARWEAETVDSASATRRRARWVTPNFGCIRLNSALASTRGRVVFLAIAGELAEPRGTRAYNPLMTSQLIPHPSALAGIGGELGGIRGPRADRPLVHGAIRRVGAGARWGISTSRSISRSSACRCRATILGVEYSASVSRAHRECIGISNGGVAAKSPFGHRGAAPACGAGVWKREQRDRLVPVVTAR
jgi:hypothetical protein